MAPIFVHANFPKGAVVTEVVCVDVADVVAVLDLEVVAEEEAEVVPLEVCVDDWVVLAVELTVVDAVVLALELADVVADVVAVVDPVEETDEVCVDVCVVTSQSIKSPDAKAAIALFIILTVALHAPTLAATSPFIPQLTRSSSPLGPEYSSRTLDNRSVQSPVFGFACKTL